MGATFIVTPGGERLAILPADEYERLAEAAADAADVAAYDRAKRAIEMGADEFVPADIAARLLAGEAPLRVWREARGLSGKALAAATGLSAPYLSQIESGERDGSLAAMKKIADALRVSIDDLVVANDC